ncbi:MAG: hypothetical protein ACSHXF_07750 [Aquaticitalea sp.]
MPVWYTLFFGADSFAEPALALVVLTAIRFATPVLSVSGASVASCSTWASIAALLVLSKSSFSCPKSVPFVSSLFFIRFFFIIIKFVS